MKWLIVLHLAAFIAKQTCSADESNEIMTFATPAKDVEPEPENSAELMTFATPGKLIEAQPDSSENMTFGTELRQLREKTELSKPDDVTKSSSVETVKSKQPEKPDKTEKPEKPGKPGSASPANALKLPKINELKETEFLAKLDPIKKVTAQLQKKSVPGEKKLVASMKKIETSADRAIDRRLKATLRIIEKSKKIADADRSKFKKQAEDAVAKARSDIESYSKQLNDSIPKKMLTISNSDLLDKIEKLLEKYATKTMDAVKDLQQMTTRLQNGINKRFAAADAELSKYIM